LHYFFLAAAALRPTQAGRTVSACLSIASCHHESLAGGLAQGSVDSLSRPQQHPVRHREHGGGELQDPIAAVDDQTASIAVSQDFLRFFERGGVPGVDFGPGFELDRPEALLLFEDEIDFQAAALAI